MGKYLWKIIAVRKQNNIFTVAIYSFTESEEIIPWLPSIFTEKKKH